MAQNANFLRLNDKCFIEEIVAMMGLTLEEEGRMTKILASLTSRHLHKQIIKILRELKKEFPEKNISYFGEFIHRASQY